MLPANLCQSVDLFGLNKFHFLTNELKILRNLELPEVQNTLSSICFYHFSFKRAWISTLFSSFSNFHWLFRQIGELSIKNQSWLSCVSAGPILAALLGREAWETLTRRTSDLGKKSSKNRASVTQLNRFSTQYYFVDFCELQIRLKAVSWTNETEILQKCPKVRLSWTLPCLAELSR